MQADSGSDFDSESRNKNKEIIPVNRLTQTVWIAPLTKDILCADWRRLSESESESESACTIRVPSGLPRNFFSGGGVQQIQLRTEDREDGDLGAVAP